MDELTNEILHIDMWMKVLEKWTLFYDFEKLVAVEANT